MTTTPARRRVPADERALWNRLDAVSIRDSRRLRHRLRDLQRLAPPKRELARAEIARAIDSATAALAVRAASVPTISYPEQLPVSQHRDEIATAIGAHQVVIVAGETGSGKTTQLPKICLELGRGIRGMIGHTQPRRIAARATAERIAEELGRPLGETVGFKMRFTDHTRDDTLVKLMTDGILLAEIQTDRNLTAYDTIIIDEAHERSLNIDFLLGYLTQLLPRRPDLKVIITSATIDSDRFAAHFQAPVTEVSGRTYPVEIRYRPPDDGVDQADAIAGAVDELAGEGPGDVLVFLSGEREIRDAADTLTRRNLAGTEVLPLYARLSAAEQHRIFTAHPGRRIVLATNVAETSLTVPGVRYVVDTGTARVSRYSHRLKVQRLPIEPVSQASANQRAGRCGRVADGVCIRLYSEQDFVERPEFTEPEILRTNLASVILQMSSLDLGSVEDFPFVQPPDQRSIGDGVRLLEELGALEPGATTKRGSPRLTAVGRQMAGLPVDPRLARMIIEGDRNGALGEVLVLAAALSIQDPRERPLDAQVQADAAHARFADPTSDFCALINLWRYMREKQKELSSSAFRRLCRQEYLHYLRLREWQDLAIQLRSSAKALRMYPSGHRAEPEAIHRSLLPGLLSHIGLKDGAKNDYLGARGARFLIFPGSPLARKPPDWIMAAELVETSRLFARTVARIDPEWIEPVAGHLVKRTYSEPRWNAKPAAVMATERVTLYGLTIAIRKANYGKVDPAASRDIFIQSALVEGDWRTQHRFFCANQRLRDELAETEARIRRAGVVDDGRVFDFYDARIPADVVSGAHFDAWWKKERRNHPDLLTMKRADLIAGDEPALDRAAFPDRVSFGRTALPLTYRFDPGGASDGVRVDIPLTKLNLVDGDGADWQAPGLRQELATELIRSLPKAIRKNLAPAPDFAAKALAGIEADEPMLPALARELRRLGQVALAAEDFDWEKVPAHLRVTFRVRNGKRIIAEGKDLERIRGQLAGQMRQTLAEAASDIERTGISSWSIGDLPQRIEVSRDGSTIAGYPALVDEDTSVSIRVLPNPEEQDRAMRAGVRRLLLLTIPLPLKAIVAGLPGPVKLALGHNPYGAVPRLLDDAVCAAVDVLMNGAGGIVWNEADFNRLREVVRPDLAERATGIVEVAATILIGWQQAARTLADLRGAAYAESKADITGQLAGLVYDGFLTDTGAEQLQQLPRYLEAVNYRLGKLIDNPGRDVDQLVQVQDLEDEYSEVLAQLSAAERAAAASTRIRWMLQEFRVSVFAQPLGTAYPVSAKRIRKALTDLIEG